MSPPLKKSFAAEQLKMQHKKSGLWILVVILAIVAVIASGYALYVRFGKVAPPAEDGDASQ